MTARDEEIAAIVGIRDSEITFGGLTASERLAQLDARQSVIFFANGGLEYHWPPSDAPRTLPPDFGGCTGIVQRGLRQGTWRFQRDGKHFDVSFVDDRPTDVPGGWRDEDWPRPMSPESHAAEVAAVRRVLQEYRQQNDAKRIAAELEAQGYARIRMLGALQKALGISLSAARWLLEGPT